MPCPIRWVQKVSWGKAHAAVMVVDACAEELFTLQYLRLCDLTPLIYFNLFYI